MPRRYRTLFIGVGLAACLPQRLLAQVPDSARPVIDTVVITTKNVFTPEQAAGNFAFRLMNGIHITTRPRTIRQELLFKAGEPYDSSKVAESERNLRARAIFREVKIDTTRIDGRLAAVVDTWDGWSTKPRIKFTVASDGTWTGEFGLSEVNLLGTGNLASLGYVKTVERAGLELSADFRRISGTQVGAAGVVTFWDDGTDGWWRLGDPFFSNLDGRSIEYDGEAADRRVLQYRVDDPAAPDTTFWQREAFINRLTAAIATKADAQSYLRWGAKAEIREEAYLPQDSLQVSAFVARPDTVYGEFGVFGEYRAARFTRVRYFNGFVDEDIDVSPRAKLTLNLALEGLGYQRNGLGPRIDVGWGKRGARAFVVSTLKANGLFTDAGLDSGRVVADLTFGIKLARKHSTAVYVQAGAQEDPPPGQEFALGFGTPPRSWEAFTFVGTREIWGTLEHRWYVWDALLNLISLGFAFFVDYGGAWYPDQDPRFGGNVGIGLRQGGALTTAARTGRLDFGCRFGQGSDVGDRCVVTLGAGFVFPWNPRAADLVKKER